MAAIEIPVFPLLASTTVKPAPVRVPLAENVERHAVLDAAGHVQLFALGVDHAPLPAVAAFDGQHRRVPRQAAEMP